MIRNWTLAALAAAVVLTGCGKDVSESAPGTITSTQAAAPAPTKAPTTTQLARTTTTASARLAYWRKVVKAMNCPEVTDLELKRLAGNFSDRAESLIAIHDRQGELNCA
jgi:ABC-type uncharacterized transport system auxiliary subunit